MLEALMKTMQTYLLTKATRVYFKIAAETSQVPYIVFDLLPSFINDESAEQLQVEINGWDIPSNGDPAVLDALMQSINGDGDIIAPTGLDKSTILANGILATFNLDSRDPLDDEDPMIKRRKFNYAVKVFNERSGD